jgi:hypothetical protein
MMEDKSYLTPFYLDVEGVSYYFDLDAYHEAVKMPPRKVSVVTVDKDGNETVTEDTEDGGLNVSKYELLKYVLEIIIEGKGTEDIDMGMGMAYGFGKMPFSFKICFNTLLNYGILKPITQ